MKKFKKLTNLLLALALAISLVPQAFAASYISSSTFYNKISSAQSSYPTGTWKYEYKVNGSVVGWQCAGFARWMTYQVYGIDCQNGNASGYEKISATSSDSKIDELCVGDVVRFRNATSYDHSIFITGISGNTITYADCNAYNDNIIRWNQTISKSTLASKMTDPLLWDIGYGYIVHYTNSAFSSSSSSSSSSTTTTSTSSEFKTGDIIRITNGNYAWNVYNGNNSNMTNLCLWSLDNSPEQDMRVVVNSDGSMSLYPLSSSNGYGKVIDVYRKKVSGSWILTSGCNADLYTANDAEAQSFEFVKLSSGKYKILVKDTSLAFTVSSKKNNSNVYVSTYTGSSYQQWTVSVVG
ncbi:MAG: CHAP domain-containing protein [Clostridia bacterium]